MRVLLTAVGLLVLLGLQATVARYLAIFGVPPDLPLVAAVVVAFSAGPLRGGLVGLAAGLGEDLLRGDLIGLFALAVGLAAWLCGEASRRVDPSRGGVRWVVGTLAAALYGVVIVGGTMFVFRLPVDPLGALRHVVIAALYDGVLVALAYWPFAHRSAAPLAGLHRYRD